MYILSPKTNFLGGALVSASHLGRLFPNHLLTWKSRSQFLDINNVPYKVVVGKDDYSQFDYEPGKKEFGSIWCNDTCVDGGYFPEYDKQNKELYEFLSEFKEVHLFNHQPPNRCREFFMKFLPILLDKGCKVTIYHYRACWELEFGMELNVIFPEVMNLLAPYHYYLDDIPSIEEISQSHRLNTAVCIGRSNSKCKVQYRFKELCEHSTKTSIYQLLPDTSKSNKEFMKELTKYKFVLTGYFYGGEGNMESTSVYNKLEWSFIDAAMAGCIPCTNILFFMELTRLGIPSTCYGYNNLLDWTKEIDKVFEHNSIHYDPIYIRQKLIKELEFGNKVMSKLILSDENIQTV